MYLYLEIHFVVLRIVIVIDATKIAEWSFY